MQNNHVRNKLDIREPIVLELSTKHNLQPKLVAYVRAAIIGEFARYNKDTLIEHIETENKVREQAIEEHKISEVLSPEDKENVIKYTQINIDFRRSVVEFLQQVSDEVLADVLMNNQPQTA